uniref:Uncharacterized protein n=1 Tax=Arundo donax TaxID=35708 RepID=A0A0A9CXH5_ARUDO
MPLFQDFQDSLLTHVISLKSSDLYLENVVFLFSNRAKRFSL